jgi:hypothetical protein
MCRSIPSKGTNLAKDVTNVTNDVTNNATNGVTDRIDVANDSTNYGAYTSLIKFVLVYASNKNAP